LSASTYGGVAQNMLFSSDRNPDVVVDVAPPKTVPAFPVAFGVMDFGRGPSVILSEKPGGSSRGYSAGDKVGEFTLVAVAADEVVFEFDGRKFPKKLRELKPESSGPPAPAVDSGPRATAVSVQSAVPLAVDTGPGAQLSDEVKACVPGDTSPAGTVRDGFVKVLNKTPFGSQCRWERTK
jgi:type II secretory pathway component PulC